MDAMELLEDLSTCIYKSPLAAFRDDDRIRDTSNPLSVLMLLIDYETECSMNGIVGFLGNSSGQNLPETIDALSKVGCVEHAKILRSVEIAASSAGMTYSAIQHDRERLQPFEVTSFNKLHGDKWEAACSTIHDLHYTVDFDDFWQKMAEFVRVHMNEIQHELKAHGIN